MPGIYIHIPFCMAKCRYCDFVSFADQDGKEDYLKALKEEMALCERELPKLEYDTVFFGGGTPSVLPAGAILRLMERLREHYHVLPDAEITIECNPGTLTEEKLKEYQQAGINRLSLGLQSADNGLLRVLGRIHTYEEFLHSLRLAREAGFTNINADLMYGLPEQTLEVHLDSIQRAAALGLEHISAYSLILEENTPLYMDVMGGGESLPDEDTAYAMHRQGMLLLQSLGYERYEISNYAKPGRQSRHNLNYWNNGPYLGLGLNSHSAMLLGGQWSRWANTAILGDYLSAVRMGERPLSGEIQPIGKREEMFECVMLGLRKTAGMVDREFRDRFGESLFFAFAKPIDELKKQGWLVEDGRSIRLTEEGLDFQNRALLAFMEEESLPLSIN